MINSVAVETTKATTNKATKAENIAVAVMAISKMRATVMKDILSHPDAATMKTASSSNPSTKAWVRWAA